MKADEVLALLEKEGVTLTVDGDDLITRPAPVVTPELVALIREHKAPLISELCPIRCEAEVFELARKHFAASQAKLAPPRRRTRVRTLASVLSDACAECGSEESGFLGRGELCDGCAAELGTL